MSIITRIIEATASYFGGEAELAEAFATETVDTRSYLSATLGSEF